LNNEALTCTRGNIVGHATRVVLTPIRLNVDAAFIDFVH